MTRDVEGGLLLTRVHAIAHKGSPNDHLDVGLALALPRLDAGAGQLAWTDVRPLVEQALGDLSIPVHLYGTYHKGQQGAEG